jgi:cytochrome c peroxidase
MEEVRRVDAALLGLCLALAACGNSQRTPNSTAEADDPDPILSDKQRSALAELSPATLPAPPSDLSNKWSDDAKAAAFGQRLFFEPGFAGKLLDGDNDGSAFALGMKGETGKVACSGCHLPESGFSDSRTVRHQISLAAGWGRRRAPSLLDVGQSKLLMWDGRKDSLFAQIFGVIESPVEMNSSRLFVAQQLFARHKDEYEQLFGPMPALGDKARFPALSADVIGCQKLDAENACPEPMRGSPGDAADFDGMARDDQDEVTRVVVNAGKALGAYERLLNCGPSRFDRWMHGESDALTRAEQRGAGLFVGAGGCVSCHSGPFLSDEAFHNVGLRAERVATTFINPNDRGAAEGLPLALSDPLDVKGAFSDGDDGRLPAAVDAQSEGAFRTPRLRCLSKRPSFMHTGQMLALDQVVSFFSAGGHSAGFPGTSELKPLGLSARERSDLVAFLQALDGPGPDSALLEAPR